MGFTQFTQSRKYKNFMAKVYGIGASIVLVGALFKIVHWPGANVMLTVGLMTEALIFFFSAFEPPHVEPDWSLVYPELAGLYHDDVDDSVIESRKSPTEKLDEMLEENNVTAQAIEKLGEGLNRLSTIASQLSEVTDATVATQEFADNMKQASETAKKLTEVMTVDVDSASEYSESLKKVAGNATALLETFDDTTESTKEFSAQVKELNDKISSLNTVYGNMLSAMRANG